MDRWMIEHLMLTTSLIVIFALVLITLSFWISHRIYRHEATKPQFGGALASLAIALLFSVLLNNLFALRRDRDNRIRALRDQHFAQLRPVLRTESLKLQEIAAQVAKQGHISKVVRYEGAELNPNIALWPEVLSHDLRNHFEDYDRAKRALLADISSQDEEFHTAVSLAEDEIRAKPNAYWQEVVAMSFVEVCSGRGEGMKLTLMDSGYSFAYWGAAMTNSGSSESPPRPSEDQVAAFRGFQSLKPDAALRSHCASLNRRAESIRHTAEDLSREAQLLSQYTFLRGTCDFLMSSNLLD